VLRGGNPASRVKAAMPAEADASPGSARRPWPTHWQPRRTRHLVLLGAIFLYAFVVLQSAWLHEDAFITYRTVDNLVNGYGPTWNVGERVQTYTHPLWFLVVSAAHALTGEIFYTGIFACWAISVAAVLVMALWVAPSPENSCLGIALLCSSKAFIDYSTSGLENPLSHLLLAVFAGRYFRCEPSLRSLSSLALVAGLATCNRMDTILLYLPALGFAAWRLRSWRAFLAVAAGFAPFVVWELFSLFYYGFLFPNTAYGKLNTGTPDLALARQGLYYLYNSLTVDPPTLVALGTGVAWLLYAQRWSGLPLALGPFLYLTYVVRIGGDYMSGRFLTVPFFGAVLLIAYQARFATRKHLGIALGAVMAMGLAAPYAPLRSGLDYGERGAPGYHHIVDERASYYASTGLLKALTAEAAYPQHEWVNLGRIMAEKSQAEELVVTTYINLGILGYYAGPKVHHLDVLGTTDPLLARLPAFADADWAPGHFARIVPEGYIETHLYGRNLIADAKLAAYYDKLRAIISGPLCADGRWLEIWRLNAGYYDHLIDYDAYRHPPEEEQGRSRARLFPPIRLRPDTLSRAIESGNRYFANQRFDLAADAYGEAIRLRPDHPSAHHNLGAVFLARGDKRQALSAFQQAAELGSQTLETYRALIWLYRKAGDQGGALRAYRLAQQHLPDRDRAALAEYWEASPQARPTE
jgi:arabinofuranosyltransferase